MAKNPTRILLAALLPMAVALPVQAQMTPVRQSVLPPPPEGLVLQAGADLIYDSNLFRSSLNQQSDTALRTTVGAGYKKRFGLQEVVLNATLVDSRYSSNNQLDATAVNYDARLNYAIGDRLTGDVGASRTEAPNSFADLPRLQNGQLVERGRNLRVTETQRAGLDVRLNPNWHLVGSLLHQLTKNEMPIFMESDTESNGATAGIRYTPATGTSVGLQAKRYDGRYINQTVNSLLLLDNEYNQNGVELGFNWQITGHSGLSARIEHMRREHPNTPSRDFSGVVGGLDYTYRYSEKTILTLSYLRTMSAYRARLDINPDDINASHYTSNGLTLSGRWAATGKTTVFGHVGFAKVDYDGAVTYDWANLKTYVDAEQARRVAGTLNTPRTLDISRLNSARRDDTVYSFGVDVAHRTYHWLELRAALFGEKRSASQGQLDYTNYRLMFSANAAF